MSLVKFLKGAEANITKLKSTSSVTEGALYVATDTGTMWLGTSKTSLLQIKDNIDTDTWRGIQNNLTSTSEIDSLSAAQGKILNEKFDSYVPISRKVNGKVLSQDISISAGDIGAAASSHTHQYAGSSSVGGSANSAVKLDSDAGSVTQPVYFSDGKPVACTAYSQAKVKEAAEQHTVVQDTADNAGIEGVLIPSPLDERNRIWLCTNDNGQLESVKVYVTE